jgi:uncharacterized protein
MSELKTVEQLREVYAAPTDRSLRKEQRRLDQHCREFIAMSPFMVLATASADGSCDVSPKGGPPGFVSVLDEQRLLVPDASGNRRLDGMQNITSNPQVAMLFLIPGMRETLRVNGRATLTDDPALLSGARTGGRPPLTAMIVAVEQAFLHCGKALIRSSLWQPDSWPASDRLPSAAAILKQHVGIGSLEESEAALQESYTQRL